MTVTVIVIVTVTVIVSALVMTVLIVTPATESVTVSVTVRVHDACMNAGYRCPSKTQPDRAHYFYYSAPRPMDSVPLGCPLLGYPPLGSPTCSDYPHCHCLPRRRVGC